MLLDWKRVLFSLNNALTYGKTDEGHQGGAFGGCGHELRHVLIRLMTFLHAFDFEMRWEDYLKTSWKINSRSCLTEEDRMLWKMEQVWDETTFYSNSLHQAFLGISVHETIESFCNFLCKHLLQKSLSFMAKCFIASSAAIRVFRISIHKLMECVACYKKFAIWIL